MVLQIYQIEIGYLMEEIQSQNLFRNFTLKRVNYDRLRSTKFGEISSHRDFFALNRSVKRILRSFLLFQNVLSDFMADTPITYYFNSVCQKAMLSKYQQNLRQKMTSK